MQSPSCEELTIYADVCLLAPLTWQIKDKTTDQTVKKKVQLAIYFMIWIKMDTVMCTPYKAVVTVGSVQNVRQITKRS